MTAHFFGFLTLVGRYLTAAKVLEKSQRGKIWARTSLRKYQPTENAKFLGGKSVNGPMRSFKNFKFLTSRISNNVWDFGLKFSEKCNCGMSFNIQKRHFCNLIRKQEKYMHANKGKTVNKDSPIE